MSTCSSKSHHAIILVLCCVIRKLWGQIFDLKYLENEKHFRLHKRTKDAWNIVPSK